MTGIVVAKVGEIPAGRRKIIVPFRGRAGIGVFNVNGSFYALRNICPHKRGPLCTGEIGDNLRDSDPPSVVGATFAYEREGQVLRCPWHNWPFEVATGQCLVDPDIRVKTYPIVVKGDQLIVDIEVSDFIAEDEVPALKASE